MLWAWILVDREGRRKSEARRGVLGERRVEVEEFDKELKLCFLQVKWLKQAVVVVRDSDGNAGDGLKGE